MTPDEILSNLKNLGVSISRSTLLRYEKAGLIPQPIRGGQGRGKGRTTEYTLDTVGEAYAAYQFSHNEHNLTPASIKKIREDALKFVNTFFTEFLDETYSNLSDEQVVKTAAINMFIDGSIFRWIEYKYKAISKRVTLENAGILIEGGYGSNITNVKIGPSNKLPLWNPANINCSFISFEDECYQISFICFPIDAKPITSMFFNNL